MLRDVAVDLSIYDWQAVGATAAILTTLLTAILVVSVFFGYRSIKETVLQRDASLLLFAIQQMESIKGDLRRLEQAPPYGSVAEAIAADFESPWDAATESSAQRVSIELQRLGYLVEAGLLSQIHLLRMWGPTIGRAWLLLDPWVKRLRLQKGEPIELDQGAFSRGDFERFARVCLAERGA
jgi:hypothetical protein